MKKRVIYICLISILFIIPIIMLYVHDNNILILVLAYILQVVWVSITIFFLRLFDKLDELIEEKEYQKKQV